MAPLPCTWTGEAFEPLPGFRRRADDQFTVGMIYHLEPAEERSAASHRHYFASINEAFANLPEHLAERFATPDHLRRFSLIKAGYADSRQIVASSRAEALRLAGFIKPMDEYAVVTVDGSVVTVWTAQSQSMKAMGKDRFQRSKDDVLGIIAEMIGVTPRQLQQNTDKAA